MRNCWTRRQKRGFKKKLKSF